jgi:hypothetical protein
MSSGRLKVFGSLYRLAYGVPHVPTQGAIVKQSDHLMDSMRYLIVSGRERMKVKSPKQIESEDWVERFGRYR